MDAASTVASSPSLSSVALQLFAASILKGETKRYYSPLDATVQDAHNAIRNRKHLLRHNPKDALLLAETALFYANIGQLHSSDRLIRRALAAAPNSRFVLRSAARFYCHDERPDEALRLLQRSSRLSSDPWLKSAELAVAGIVGAPIKGWRDARGLSEDTALSSRDRSELSAELATLEFSAGARRSGLRKIKTATEDPTENTSAQVEFLAGKTKDFSVEEYVPDLSSSMEAKANNAFRKGEFRSALESCEAWHELEPFSARPPIFGSFLSTAKSNSVDRGIELAKSGLIGNQNNATLLNNLAVLMSYKGDLDAAEHFAKRARASSEDKSDIANIATKGLILFRRGELEGAVQLYEEAIERAVTLRNAPMAIRAYAFLAREMCRVDPSLKKQFFVEFGKIERRLSKVGARLPQDVSLIVTEFTDDAVSTSNLLLDFKPFADNHLGDGWIDPKRFRNE